MLLRAEHNAIVYKYNKYIQVSGSLFYAFEYLLKTLEVNPESNIRFYVIIPSNQKKDYLMKLRRLFQTKYPLIREYKDRLILDEYQRTLNAEDFSNILKKIKILNEAFSRIITCSSLDLALKLKFNKVMFVNYNSWLNTSYNADTTFVIQNRNINTLDKSEIIKNKSNNTNQRIMFLYEMPEQKFPYDIGYIQYQYNLKLATDYFIPKDMFNSKDKTKSIISGKPIVNTTFEDNQKPSLFIGVKDKPLLNTRKVLYYQNFLNYDENCRLLIEARFYKIPISIIKTETKDLRNMSNFRVAIPKDLPEDSSVPRMKEDLSNYTLDTKDFLIDLLASNNFNSTNLGVQNV